MDSGHLDVLNFKDVLHVFGEVFPEHGVRHLQKEMGKKQKKMGKPGVFYISGGLFHSHIHGISWGSPPKSHGSDSWISSRIVDHHDEMPRWGKICII